MYNVELKVNKEKDSFSDLFFNLDNKNEKYSYIFKDRN
jgi:predicted CopG family antitoxin